MLRYLLTLWPKFNDQKVFQEDLPRNNFISDLECTMYMIMTVDRENNKLNYNIAIVMRGPRD